MHLKLKIINRILLLKFLIKIYGFVEINCPVKKLKLKFNFAKLKLKIII